MLGLIENTGTNIARVKDKFTYSTFDQVEFDRAARFIEILPSAL